MHSRRLSIVATTATLVLSGGGAMAQESNAPIVVGYGGLPTRAPRGGQTGLQVTEGTLLHAGAGAEAGYDSNVYYAAGGSDTGAGLFRATGFLEYTNATRSGEVPSNLFFDIGASLQYREYLSDRVDEQNRRAFNPQVGAALELSGSQAVSLTLSDSFARTEDPPYFLGQGPIIRYGNQALAQVRLSPGGGRLQGIVRYTNSIDLFGASNTSYSYADSMSHEGMLDFSWKWLPKTAIFIQGRQGYVQYFNGASNGQQKRPSYPLRASIGLRGLITEKTTVGVALGYANAFYSSGENTSGLFGSTYVSADVMYRPLLLTLVTLGYRHDFQNSLISNFYYLDGVYLTLQQQLLGRVTIGMSGRWERRNFRGNIATVAAPEPLDRIDNFFQAGATADVALRGGFYLGVGYSLLVNESDYAPINGGPSPDYVKHQVFGRLGVTY
jgi:hypothetical protein